MRHQPANDKLPRGHAYIRMRNRGGSIDIEYPEIDSDQAARIMEAAMAIVREDLDMAKVADQVIAEGGWFDPESGPNVS